MERAPCSGEDEVVYELAVAAHRLCPDAGPGEVDVFLAQLGHEALGGPNERGARDGATDLGCPRAPQACE